MTRIFLEGQEIKFSDWYLSFPPGGELRLTIIYASGRRYSRPYDEWRVEPTIERDEKLLWDKKQQLFQTIEHAVEVGRKYVLVTYPSGEKTFLRKFEEVEVVRATDIGNGDIFSYFREIAEERVKNAKEEDDRIIAQNVVAQFNKIVPFEGTALNAYITKRLETRKAPENLIFPFGINETQMYAVKQAFSSQLSIIEGPPGTGKTQTILNIIANIVINGKTCAVISNNNSAVENVYEKLEKKQLDFLVAKLGKGEKRKDFFALMDYRKPDEVTEALELEALQTIFYRVEKHLSSRNQLAKIVNEIREIEIEKEYLDLWQKEHPEVKATCIEKYLRNDTRVMDLLAYMKYLEEKSLRFRDRWKLLWHHRIFRSGFLNDLHEREDFIFSLQTTYYENLLREKMKEKEALEISLKAIDYEHELERLIQESLNFLYQYVSQNLPETPPSFTNDDYQKKNAEFIKYFSVIGSSTHSLVSSLAEGYLLDYVIIDEASQQDLVPGILSFGCAKNAIIVGDRKQLPHIPQSTEIMAPDRLYDCVAYSLLDSVSEIFKEKVPRALLKEHYRCHPDIIQFCNQEFYENQLIPMTEDHGEKALSLVVTARGNHARGGQNQREIASVLKTNQDCGFLDMEESSGKAGIGFIAPYNMQINLAKTMMPDSIVKSTIHKFQGRECDEIIFSTVLDKKRNSQEKVDFLDNAALINVAVSRAKNKFTLVTGQDVFTKNNKHIASLIRYMEYYTPEEELHYAPVISAFDLLYAEYDKSLKRLEKRLNPNDSKFKSEQIMAAIIRDVLSQEKFKILMFHQQVYLKQLVQDEKQPMQQEHIEFSDREESYMRNMASCDFVIYYKTGKKPIAAAEVDGDWHDTPEQQERDRVKNSVLQKAGIPWKRIRTTDGDVEGRLEKFLLSCVCAEEKLMLQAE